MLHCCSSSRHQSIYSSIAGYTVVSASLLSFAYIFRRQNHPFPSRDTSFEVIFGVIHQLIVLTTSIYIFIATIRLLSLLGVITIIVLSFLWGQTASICPRQQKIWLIYMTSSTSCSSYSVSQTISGACEGLQCMIVYTLCLM